MVRSKNIVLGITLVIIVGAILVLENPVDDSTIGRIDRAAQPGNDAGSAGVQEGTAIGDRASEFAFNTFDGQRVQFSDFRGQGLVVNAWSGWCPFCIDEMPDMQAESNKRDQVTVLFIHRTKTENIDIGRIFIAEQIPQDRGIQITDPVLTDPTDEFYNTFFGFGMPVTLFLDENGVIVDKKIGPLTREEIEEKFAAIDPEA